MALIGLRPKSSLLTSRFDAGVSMPRFMARRLKMGEVLRCIGASHPASHACSFDTSGRAHRMPIWPTCGDRLEGYKAVRADAVRFTPLHVDAPNTRPKRSREGRRASSLAT